MESHWLEVDKKRWVHRFGWVGGDLVPVGEEAVLYAEFEAGNVSVAGADWSTLCVECSGGPQDELMRLMSATMIHLEKTGWLTGRLPGERACSYPEWLSGLPPIVS